MKKEEISMLIEERFYSFSEQKITRVTYKNGKIFHGIFHQFADFDKLRSQNQHRFIPNNSVLAFRVELENTQIQNTNHSVVLDCDQIVSVELIEPSL